MNGLKRALSSLPFIGSSIASSSSSPPEASASSSAPSSTSTPVAAISVPSAGGTITPIVAGSPSISSPVHVVVCLHGIHGRGSDLHWFRDQLMASSSSSRDAHRYLVVIIRANEGRTHDGISTGGERAAMELLAAIAMHPQLRYISVVGHSLGGLYARAMLGFLLTNGLLDRLQCVNFVTLAAPHMGCRQLMKRYTKTLTTVFSRYALGDTGRELMWFDGHDTGVAPLLVRLCHAPYITALQKFRHLTCYANICNDISVPYSTAAICTGNPYSGVSTSALPRKDQYPIIVSKRRWRLRHRSVHDPSLIIPSSISRPPLSSLSSSDERDISTLTMDELRSELAEARVEIRRLRLALVLDTNTNTNTNPSTNTTSSDTKTPIVASPTDASIVSASEAKTSSDGITAATTATTTMVTAIANVVAEPLIDEEDDNDTERTPILMRQASAPVVHHHLHHRSSSSDHKVPTPTSLPNATISSPASSSSSLSKASVSSSSLLPSSFRTGSLHEMFTILSSLPWRRVDVVGRAVLAHTDIAVKHHVVNATGKPVIAHLINRLQRVEQRLISREVATLVSSSPLPLPLPLPSAAASSPVVATSSSSSSQSSSIVEPTSQPVAV